MSSTEILYLYIHISRVFSPAIFAGDSLQKPKRRRRRTSNFMVLSAGEEGYAHRYVLDPEVPISAGTRRYTESNPVTAAVYQGAGTWCESACVRIWFRSRRHGKRRCRWTGWLAGGGREGAGRMKEVVEGFPDRTNKWSFKDALNHCV